MSAQTFIVVDSLDECSGMNDIEFDNICSFVASLADGASGRVAVNVLIFSRPGYQPINKAVKGSLSIQIDEGANMADINTFICHET
jgi:hypothetical protein